MFIQHLNDEQQSILLSLAAQAAETAGNGQGALKELERIRAQVNQNVEPEVVDITQLKRIFSNSAAQTALFFELMAVAQADHETVSSPAYKLLEAYSHLMAGKHAPISTIGNWDRAKKYLYLCTDHIFQSSSAHPYKTKITVKKQKDEKNNKNMLFIEIELPPDLTDKSGTPLKAEISGASKA